MDMKCTLQSFRITSTSADIHPRLLRKTPRRTLNPEPSALPPLPMHPWLASRTASFDSSVIRKVVDLAAKMKDPITLSIGQPDFDVPEAARQAMVDAVQHRKNGYSQTQGVAPLLERLQKQVDAEFGHADRKLFIT